MEHAPINFAGTQVERGGSVGPSVRWAYDNVTRSARRRRPSADQGEILVTHARRSRRRTRIERFISEEYRDHFGARIPSFMPVLVGLHDSRGEVLGAVGCRAAAEERLFLETYTRAPIEAVLARRFGVEVRRDEIVEVGSLACRNGRVALAMVQALVPYLLGAGYAWVVLTGADTVVRVFERLRLAPTELCVADRDLLDPAARRVWGTYYEHHPRVMAGKLLDGIQMLGHAPVRS
jgi:hypothetical protein